MKPILDTSWLEPVFDFDFADRSGQALAAKPESGETVDYPGSRGPDSPVAPLDGTPFGATTHFYQDYDVFVFSIDQTGQLSLAFVGAPGGTFELFRIIDGGAAQLVWITTEGSRTVELEQTGDYFFQFSSAFVGAELTATATFRTDDHGNTALATQSALVRNGQVSGTIDYSGDNDYFYIDVTAGETLRFTSSLTGSDSFFRLYEMGLDRPRYVGSDAVNGIIEYHFVNAGRYLIRMNAPAETSGLSYTITTTVVSDPEAEGPSTEARVAVDGDDYIGAIDFPRDADWIGIELDSSAAVQISLSAPDYLTDFIVYDADRNAVASTTYAAANSSLVFQPPSAGLYFVSVIGRNAPTDPVAVGAYTLNVRSVADDFGSDPASAGVLTLNGSATTGTSNFTGDLDLFRITSATDQTVRIIVDSAGLVDSYPSLRVYNASGVEYVFYPYQWAAQEDGSQQIILTLPMTAGGVAFVGIDYLRPGATYSITAASTTDDQQGSPPTLSTNGIELSGSVDFEGDVDTFLVTVADGDILELRTPLILDAYGSEAFAPLLYTMDGTRIYRANEGSASDGSHWTNTFVGLAAGTYQVRLTPSGDHIGDYTLSAAIVTDDMTNVAGGAIAPLSYGGRIAGTLDYGGDTDVFGIMAPQTGSNYRFSLRSLDGDFVAPAITLLEPGNAQIFQTGASAATTVLNLVATLPAGLSYVQIGANLGAAVGYDVVGDWVLDVYYRLTNGNDVITASNEADIIEGLNGNDIIQGLAGNDRLFGNAGNDTLSGGVGNDFLYGSTGSDKLHGGSGMDVFVVGNSDGVDIISDFHPTWDTLQILDGAGATRFSDLNIQQVGADVLITFSNGGAVRLIGIDIELVGPGNFVFPPPAAASQTPSDPASSEVVPVDTVDYAAPDVSPDHFDFSIAADHHWHFA